MSAHFGRPQQLPHIHTADNVDTIPAGQPAVSAAVLTAGLPAGECACSQQSSGTSQAQEASGTAEHLRGEVLALLVVGRSADTEP